MAKCTNCHSCLRTNIVFTDNRMYLICKLCKKVWRVVNRDMLEIDDKELINSILKFVNMEIID